MTRRLGFLLLAAVAVLLVASTLAAAGGTAGTTAQITQPQTTPGEFENTLFRIRVFENGSARWTIQHSRPLNDSEVDRFETFADEFNSQNTTTYTAFQTRAENLVTFGRNVTDRDMAATGFSRDAYVSELGQTRGVVEMSFVWTHFGRTDGDRVRVGDVFEGGMYVGDGQRLQLGRGPTLAFVEVDPDPDSMTNQSSLTESESVTWFGETQFADQQPSAVLAPRGAVATPGEGSNGGNGQDGAPPESDSDGPLPMVGGLVLLLAAALGIAWYVGLLPTGRTTATESGDAGAESGRAAGAAGGSTAAPEVPSEELLSDEDRVLRLLEENGGRMKQVRIVEKTDWSKSKVSMLLSDMEEENRISKLRLGRENIISLAGEEPDAAGSPFDEEE